MLWSLAEERLLSLTDVPVLWSLTEEGELAVDWSLCVLTLCVLTLCVLTLCGVLELVLLEDELAVDGVL